MLRHFVRRWRSMGHGSFIYINDGISGARDLITAKAASQLQRSDLKSSGLKAKESKSHWEPMQVEEWLGFLINTIAMTFHVPQRKIEKLYKTLNTLVVASTIEIRDLARVAGQIVSMTLDLGPIVRLFTCQMYFRIESRTHWHQSITMDSALADELKFWLQHVEAFNGYAISGSLAAITSIVYSDASDMGYGGYTATIANRYHSVGLWSDTERKQSSTWREMKAIVNVLQSFQQLLTNQAVVWFTDSANAV